MKKRTFGKIVLAIVLFFNWNLVYADILDGEQAVAPPAAADCCCDCGGAFVFDVEWTFLRLHDSDGFATDNVTGFESAPRFTVGYVTADGLGARVRYWAWDHTGDNAGVPVSVDTYNIDFELYRVIDLTCNTTIEVAGGIRYNDYSDLNLNVGGTTSTFSGYGGVFEIRAMHALCLLGVNGRVYGRAAWAILLGNETVNNIDRQFDTTNSQEEIGFGYEVVHCLNNGSLLNLRVGAEFQNWNGYSDANDSPIAFGGFLFGAGLNF